MYCVIPSARGIPPYLARCYNMEIPRALGTLHTGFQDNL